MNSSNYTNMENKEKINVGESVSIKVIDKNGKEKNITKTEKEGNERKDRTKRGDSNKGLS